MSLLSSIVLMVAKKCVDGACQRYIATRLYN